MQQPETSREMRRRAGSWEHLFIAVVLIPSAIVGVMWAAGWVVATLTGRAYTATPIDALTSFFAPGMVGPALGAGPTAAVWVVFAVLLAAATALVVAVGRALSRQRRAAATDIREEKGLPDRGTVAKNYGAKQVMKRRKEIRPDFDPEDRKPVVTDYAFWDGSSAGVKVYTSFETPTMLLAPSRVGKTQNVIGPRIAGAPGAVFSTSTKTEVVRMTWDQRKKLGGPMLICDPEGVGAEAGLPGSVRWSLWAGCDDVNEALARARVLSAGGGEGVKNADFWEATTRRVFTPLLYAAAIDPSVTVNDFQKWCFDPKGAEDALDILNEAPNARDLADLLRSVVEMDDKDTRANMWAPAANVGMSLISPSVKEAFGTGGEQFDIDEYLRESGTIYLIGQENGNAGPLVLTLVDAVWRRAIVMANGAAGGRIEPPLHLSLDEVGNIGTLPALPRMMSEGGGLGVQTTAGFQSLAQAETRFGESKARSLWEASTQRIVLGGVSDGKVLSALSRVAGRRTVVKEATSSARRGEQIGRSYSSEKENVLEESQIETMPRGIGLMIEATKPLIVTEFEPHFRRYPKDKRSARKQETTATSGSDE